MSEPIFSSKEMLQRLRQVPELAYEFSAEELQGYTKQFLQIAGYEPGSVPSTISSQPDFLGKRQAEGASYMIIGFVAERLSEVADKFGKLVDMKKVLGNAADYVLVLPPVSERPLIDFLCADRGQWYFRFKDEEFTVWLCNPEQETMWCILGSPRDRLFDDYFAFTNVSFDMLIGTRLLQDFPEE